MPVCENCNYKWTYGQTTIEQLRLRKGMRCPNCHEKQYPTKKSQAIDVIISLVLIFTLVTVKNMDQPSLINIFLYAVGIFTVQQLVRPFITSLSNTKTTL
ncbi:TIGR04104 family putative zinc finger protein [Virgibacillus halodenitrificans]|uniref:TIGR04104 family putative zinc finger protein n=1 Tax=Virgibacillus halodenitrificans TaxID=1482 RepID=UPI001F307C62|nr:TIGR04104 family putative zinc finger protein [Virgibacillus halodenitrificans]